MNWKLWLSQYWNWALTFVLCLVIGLLTHYGLGKPITGHWLAGNALRELLSILFVGHLMLFRGGRLRTWVVAWIFRAVVQTAGTAVTSITKHHPAYWEHAVGFGIFVATITLLVQFFWLRSKAR